MTPRLVVPEGVVTPEGQLRLAQVEINSLRGRIEKLDGLLRTAIGQRDFAMQMLCVAVEGLGGEVKAEPADLAARFAMTSGEDAEGKRVVRVKRLVDEVTQ